MAPVGLVLSVQLKQLLYTALADGSTYSALVPWVLDSENKGCTLLQHAQERQCLQHVQLPAGHARPQDMQQCVMQVVAEASQYSLALTDLACAQTQGQRCADMGPLAALQPARSINSKQQQARTAAVSTTSRPSSAGSPCSLSQPAVRLAKLHGHLLSHLAAPDLAQQLQQLLMMLTAGPLDIECNSTSGPTRSNTDTSSKQCTSKMANRNTLHDSRKAAAAADQAGSADAPAATQAPTAVDSPQQLLPCRTCATKYAAKALECCSKLLSCMPVELQQALVCSVHLQLYSPLLTSLLSKNLAAGPGAPGAAASMSLPAATTPWQQQHGQAACAECTPAPGGSGLSGSRPGVLGWAAAATPGSAGSGGGTAWLTDTRRSLPGSSQSGARQSSRTPASARLSGVGLLMPTMPAGSGLPSRPASAGHLPAGGKAAKTAAVCNREKSRDLFFTILRRASSKLDTLRQAQESAAPGATRCPQQAEAATAADMAELLSEVGVAAKQLLLQLAPSNLGYLAELFMACVLQAASTGQPLLEPALVLIAEKDPSRFHKLQQRLADRPAGTAASPGAAGTPGSNSSSRQAPRTGPGGAKQKQSAMQASQVQGDGQQKASGELSSSSLSAGQADGLVHVMHARTHNRPAKHPQQQPHILAATAGRAALQQAMAAAHNANSGKAVSKPLVPQGHIIPKASTSHSQQQRQGSAGQQLGGTGTSNSNGTAASPVPLAAAGPADSPLPASCLSPLFAAASESPLTSVVAPSAATRAAGGSPLYNSSTALVRAVPAASVLGGRVPDNSSQPAASQPQAATFNRSTISPAARILPGAFGTAGPLQKPGAAAAMGMSTKPPAGGPSEGSGPHSAPSKLQAALLHSGSTPGAGAGPVLAQHGSGPAQFMLQLLNLMPVSQHVLVVLLHAADSSSFNKALLGVVSSRVEKLLSSSPGSFTAASGLGQQAAAIAALGSYCSYLAFAVGASEPEGPAAAPSDSGVLLQQQPLLDIATMLQRLVASSVPGGSSTSSSTGTTELQQPAGCSELDMAWRLALAMPFAASCMRLAGLNPSAAASPCMQAALSTLHTLRRLPALSPTTPGFGALPVCVGCCIHSCHLSSGQAATAAAAALGPFEPLSSRLDELSRVVASGSCLVDSSYWSICCPGLQQLLAVLAAAAVAASPVGPSGGGPVSLSARASRAQQQRQQDKAPVRAGGQQQPIAGSQAPGADGSAASTQAAATDTGKATPCSAAAAAGGGGAKSQSSASSSPAGAAAARHTTPLLLAPRGPTEVPSPPAMMLDALAAVSDPVRQQLQQAFISQYSTDDNPVKMRDVLTVINGILFANSLSKALSQGLPGVLQKHLDLLQQAVQQQLTPAAQGVAAGAATQLHGQDLARAVHMLYSQQLCVALPEALEAAMQAAAHHACQAAAAACGALLPADVPPAAATTAAAMVTASCKATCAQRLLHEVPVLVQSTLADAADDLVRLVNRQWAVHARMTVGAAGAAAGGMGAVTRTDSSNSIRTSGGSSTDGRQRARLQPVKLEAAAVPTAVGGPAAAATVAAAPPENIMQAEAVQEEGPHTDRLAQQSRNARRVVAAPAGGKGSAAAKRSAVFGGAVGSCSETVEAAGSSLIRPTADSPTATEGADHVEGEPAEATAAALPAAAADPGGPAAIVADFLAAHAPTQSCQQGMPQQQALVSGFTAAAEAAAQQLVAGVTDRHFSMGEVEQLLIQALQQAQVATQAAQPSITGSNSACVATGDQPSIQLQVSVPVQEHLLLLLAGALMHALMCCPAVKAVVWAGGMKPDIHEAEAAAAVGLLHLTQLPVLLMKAARGEMPLWLLRQLRQWMQQATLGCH